MDAGFRLNLSPSLRLVAGVFVVRKPYFALDKERLFRQLGQRENRGLEVSIAGQITPRLNLVLGALLLNARVSGDAVDLGLIGPRPVGSIARNINGAINWNLPWVDGISLDFAYEGTSDRIANSANSLVIPARYAAAIGGRYRFKLANKPTTFRAQLASLNDARGFNNIGEGFYYNLPRRFLMSLTVDM
jgi:iron complex outermembrane receptor protein